MRERARTAVPVLLLACALSVLFWGELWRGGALAGYDLYLYYLPLRAFVSERLAQGELPLWNPLTGHGYPLLGESQAGLFYPPNLILYTALPMARAYAASQLLHSLGAFAFTWLFARRVGLSPAPAAFAALVYTYAWFPTQSQFEWSIIGGAHLPLALWCVESFLVTGRRRYAAGLCGVLAVQMLAGHFNLAFITQLLVVGYAALRLATERGRGAAFASRAARIRSAVAVGGALVLALGLAGVQLVPAWELKQRSQRATFGEEHHPSFGSTPPAMWVHTLVPWYVSDLGDADELGERRVSAAVHHLYFGLFPIALALLGLFSRPLGLPGGESRHAIWWPLGGGAFLYTSGWLVPLTERLPGFSYFIGPSRYAVVAVLAVAILAAATLDRLLRTRAGRRGPVALLLALAFLVTPLDLWLSWRAVRHVEEAPSAPFETIAASPVRRILAGADAPPRVWARHPNTANLLGVASIPAYLTFGPREYFEGPLRRVTHPNVGRLRDLGVTHVLLVGDQETFRDPRVRLLWEGFDPVLGPIWEWIDGEKPRLFLYELRGGRGRVDWIGRSAKLAVRELAANRVAIDVRSRAGGRLVLMDLMYPGWTVAIDGEPAEALRFEEAFRAVDVPPGAHRVVWSYRPRSLVWGGAVSLASASLLAGILLAGRRARRSDHST